MTSTSSRIKVGNYKCSDSVSGFPALLYAATSNNLELVKFLFQLGAKVINSEYLHHFLWTHCTDMEILALLYQNGLDLLYQVAGNNSLGLLVGQKPGHTLLKQFQGLSSLGIKMLTFSDAMDSQQR